MSSATQPRNTKHKHHHHISQRCLTHCTTGHRGQLNTHYHHTTYPSSLQITYDTITDQNKTDRLSQTTRQLTGRNSRKTQSPLSLRPPYPPTYTANIIFTNIILMTDKHNLPKGKMHSNCRLFRDHIVCGITQGDIILGANTCDPTLKFLKEEITSNIQKHKQNLWKEHWDHRHHTRLICKTILGLSNRVHPLILITSLTFNNKIATTPKHIANCFSKQFTNTVKLAIHKTNRSNNRATHKTQGYKSKLATTHVQEAIKQCKITTYKVMTN